MWHLIALWGKSKAIAWLPCWVQAFEGTRKAIAVDAQLMWKDDCLPLLLRTDASRNFVVAVLVQVKDEVENPYMR